MAEKVTEAPEATFDAELSTITKVDDGVPEPPHPDRKLNTPKTTRRAMKDFLRRPANPRRQRPAMLKVVVVALHCPGLLAACGLNGPCIEIVRVDDPAPFGMVAGEKLQVVPAGKPLPQLRETAPVNPRIGVTVSASVVVPPAEMVSADGLGLTVKSGFETMIVSGLLVTPLKS